MSKGKWMDEKQIRKIESETWQKCMILSAAYLMDEFGYDEDRVISYWDGLTRYLDAIDQKIITMDKVCDIIHEHTGLDLKRRKK